MKKTELFEIKTDGSEGISVYQVDAGKVNPIADNIQCLETFSINETTYVIAFEKDSGIACIYKAYNDDGTFMKEVAKSPVSFNVSQLAILETENNPLCLAYDGSIGIVTFLEITSELEINLVYKLDVGTGVSTFKSFIYRKKLFFVAYNIETGHVSKYEVSVNTSPYSVSAKIVWTDKWAQGWTHFSFFQLGAENFFIKTNIKYDKVNIDHFMDDPDEGSHPVLNIDAPSQMAGLNNVNAFTDQKGFPFFATYRSKGEMTFNRIYGSCLGWDNESELNTELDKQLMLALIISQKNYILIY